LTKNKYFILLYFRPWGSAGFFFGAFPCYTIGACAGKKVRGLFFWQDSASGRPFPLFPTGAVTATQGKEMAQFAGVHGKNYFCGGGIGKYIGISAGTFAAKRSS